jgi:hypothetical protein
MQAQLSWAPDIIYEACSPALAWSLNFGGGMKSNKVSNTGQEGPGGQGHEGRVTSLLRVLR